MKRKLILCLAFVLGGGLFGCSTNTPNHSAGLPLRYHNAQYDFTFFLPTSWKGYSVLIQQWNGETYFPATDRTAITERGQTITLRNPHWTAGNPYQDIPIDIFTRNQWDALHHGKFWPSLYAGGVMGEIWHNTKYVFAMNNRYSWREVEGVKEAVDIVEQNCAANPQDHLYPE